MALECMRLHRGPTAKETNQDLGFQGSGLKETNGGQSGADRLSHLQPSANRPLCGVDEVKKNMSSWAGYGKPA